MAFSHELPDYRCVEVLGLCTDVGVLDPELEAETVENPGGTWVVTTHEGPASMIFGTFGRMQQWAADHGYADTGEKTDDGYRLDGVASPHQLAIRVRS